MYTVKQIADLAGVSRRTIHYYDELGILPPSRIGSNGYRYYNHEDILKLQQVLLFRQMDFDLEKIHEILANPEFDKLQALQAHRIRIEKEVMRMKKLLKTVDATIHHVKGESDMNEHRIFEGLDKETEAKYETEAMDTWGETAQKSAQKWKNYGKKKQEEIITEGREIYRDWAEKISLPPDNKEVQTIAVRWHQHIRYFYEPTNEILLGLSKMYIDDPRFRKNIAKEHPDLPGFLSRVIPIYVESIK